jgi:hypothetical protein
MGGAVVLRSLRATLLEKTKVVKTQVVKTKGAALKVGRPVSVDALNYFSCFDAVK